MIGEHMPETEFDRLKQEIHSFAQEHDWEKLHTPKNLAMAVSGEAGELAAEFQWLTPEESAVRSLSKDKLRAISYEIADVQIYLLRLADVLNIDVPNAVREKMLINEKRF
jgi:NTP pyrophosphatase (non-canonical NTP hydrolase)